jgi:sterol desaturase/sphingolipid hydroxylase (fatty acid hydroxylase superfamily)
MTTATRTTTLGEELAFFVRQRNPRIMAAALLVVVAARISVGDWGGADLAVALGLVALQPFSEWVIHVFVLHYRPVTVFGRTIDFELARKHREHHADPTDVALVFIPFRSLLVSMAVGGALLLLLLPTLSTALTAMVVTTSTLLVYEWTHYLIHSRYRPKTRLFRAVWRAHRLHHYKNEQYWFGVTNPAADHLLRTFPDPSDVPTSPTARALHAS